MSHLHRRKRARSEFELRIAYSKGPLRGVAGGLVETSRPVSERLSRFGVWNSIVWPTDNPIQRRSNRGETRLWSDVGFVRIDHAAG
jgi:hypothetical protein